MSIFSKVKKARKAASQHQKNDSCSSTSSTSSTSTSSSTSTQDQQQKPAPAPYVHVPTHAARDAMVGLPSLYTSAEARARIAAETSKRALTRHASRQDSTSKAESGRRTVREVKLPPRASITRTQSDLSIESVLRNQSPGHNQGQGRYERRSDPGLASSASSEEGKKTSPYTYSPATDPTKAREKVYFGHQRTRTLQSLRSPLAESMSGQERDSVAGSSANSTHTASSSSSKSHYGLELKPYNRHSSSTTRTNSTTASIPNNSYFPSFAPPSCSLDPYAVQPPSTASIHQESTLATVTETKTPPQTPDTIVAVDWHVESDAKARKKSWFGSRRTRSFVSVGVSAH